MASNVRMSRYRRLQSALTGKPLEKRTREELEEIATLARVEVEGTGADGWVTVEDLRGALRGAARPVASARQKATASASRLQGLDFASDEAAERAEKLSSVEISNLRQQTASGANGGYTVADVKAAQNHHEEE